MDWAQMHIMWMWLIVMIAVSYLYTRSSAPVKNRTPPAKPSFELMLAPSGKPEIESVHWRVRVMLDHYSDLLNGRPNDALARYSITRQELMALNLWAETIFTQIDFAHCGSWLGVALLKMYILQRYLDVYQLNAAMHARKITQF